MFITGNPLTDLLTYLAFVLPLLSVAFILFKKEYRDNSMTLVMVLCLFFFLQRLLVQNAGLFDLSYPLLHNIFSLVEFVLTVMIFRQHFHTDRLRIMLNGFLIAWFSCTVTYSLIEGFNDDQFGLRFIQYGLMAGLMVTMMVQLMLKPAAGSMGSPIFWIAVSNLFFYGFMMFWETAKHYVFRGNPATVSEAETFPLLVVTIRFTVFAIAIWFLEPVVKAPQRKTVAPQQQRTGHVTIRGPYDLIREDAFVIPGSKNG
jgi:hypothetical protein